MMMKQKEPTAPKTYHTEKITTIVGIRIRFIVTPFDITVWAGEDKVLQVSYCAR